MDGIALARDAHQKFVVSNFSSSIELISEQRAQLEVLFRLLINIFNFPYILPVKHPIPAFLKNKLIKYLHHGAQILFQLFIWFSIFFLSPAFSR
jgi:hypothetical protein